jgi:hypothetical protein
MTPGNKNYSHVPHFYLTPTLSLKKERGEIWETKKTLFQKNNVVRIKNGEK